MQVRYPTQLVFEVNNNVENHILLAYVFNRLALIIC